MWTQFNISWAGGTGIAVRVPFSCARPLTRVHTFESLCITAVRVGRLA